jgi:lipopolysaccharide assembly outer membrane protein LptD (OstA)
VLIVAPGSVTVQTKDATVKADSVTLDAEQTALM